MEILLDTAAVWKERNGYSITSRASYCLVILFSSIAIFCSGQSDSISLHGHSIGYYYHPNDFNSSEFDSKYLNNSLIHFLDNSYDNVYYHLESTGDFSAPDPYVIAFLGSSYKWNNYTFDKHRINQLTRPGNALYRPQLNQLNLNIDHQKRKIDFLTHGISDQINFQFNRGELGGRVPWADWWINELAGHPSSFQRMPVEIMHRKRMNYQFNGEYIRKHASIHGQKHSMTSFDIGSRRHATHGFEGPVDFMDESFIRVQNFSKFPMKNDSMFMHIMSSFNRRNKYFAEFHFEENETATNNELSVSAFLTHKRLQTGINYTISEIEKNNPGFSRNIVDQDGEGLEPWYASGSTNELSHHLIWNKNINPKIRLHLDLFNGVVLFNPSETTFNNTLFYQPSTNEFHGLEFIRWESNSFASGLLDNEFRIEYKEGDAFKIKVNPTFDGLLLKNKSIVNLSWEAALSTKLKFGKRKISSVEFLIGKLNNPFDYDQVKYLSDDYLNGDHFYWNDLNNDRTFSDDEQGDLIRNSGGNVHLPVENLPQSYTVYAELPITLRTKKAWIFTITGQYQQYRNTWTTRYAETSELLGSNIDIDGQSVFYLDKNLPTSFEVVPFRTDLFETEKDGNTNWLFEHPFYAGSTFKLEKQWNKFFLSASFTAYMTVGFGHRGNGPLHSNINSLSETSADPNFYTKHVGRLDTDRSFTYRMLMNWQPSEKLNMTFSVKYKDGQSFSSFIPHLNATALGNQVALINRNIKGDNPFTGLRGTREDYFLNIELRGKYEFNNNWKMSWQIYNIMDLGNELIQYNFPLNGTPGRYSLDLQVPRGIILSGSYSF